MVASASSSMLTGPDVFTSSKKSDADLALGRRPACGLVNHFHCDVKTVSAILSYVTSQSDGVIRQH